MRILSVVKATALVLTFAPVAASADYVSLFEGTNLTNLGTTKASNGAYLALPYGSDQITLPIASSTATQVNLTGTLDFLSSGPSTDIKFTNLYISVPNGVVFADVSKNGTSVATGADLFQLAYGSSDLTLFQQFTFTADGTSLYKALTGGNPGGTKLNSDGSFKTGGLGGGLQAFTGPLPAPEPAAIALFGLGAGLLGLARRRAK